MLETISTPTHNVIANISYDFLIEHYVNQKKSMWQIARMFNCSASVIQRKIRKFNIQTRSVNESIRLGLMGKKFTQERCENISKSKLGKKMTQQFRDKRSKYMSSLRGKDSHGWKGGITPLSFRIRNSEEYVLWRDSVFQRDDYRCVKCLIRGNHIEAHHRKQFSFILNEFLQKYSQFSPIEDKETLVRLALSYEDFWDINNGETLCKQCHDSLLVVRSYNAY